MVVQGSHSLVFVPLEEGEADKIEGDKDGVTARIQPNGFIDVCAAEDARLEDVELTVKNKAGVKLVTLRVGVKKAESSPEFDLAKR
jgi:hypothetical protein